nr:hypothetical protein [Sedimentitalea xiamensis]
MRCEYGFQRFVAQSAETAETAACAKEGGFDVVWNHAARGYLLSQFLSPLTNLRSGRWGLALENHARILIGIVRARRKESRPESP